MRHLGEETSQRIGFAEEVRLLLVDPPRRRAKTGAAVTPDADKEQDGFVHAAGSLERTLAPCGEP